MSLASYQGRSIPRPEKGSRMLADASSCKEIILSFKHPYFVALIDLNGEKGGMSGHAKAVKKCSQQSFSLTYENRNPLCQFCAVEFFRAARNPSRNNANSLRNNGFALYCLKMVCNA
jgi:hypothetical protein